MFGAGRDSQKRRQLLPDFLNSLYKWGRQIIYGDKSCKKNMGVVTEESGNLTRKKNKVKNCQKTNVSCEFGAENVVAESWEATDDLTLKKRKEIIGLVPGSSFVGWVYQDWI